MLETWPELQEPHLTTRLYTDVDAETVFVNDAAKQTKARNTSASPVTAEL